MQRCPRGLVVLGWSAVMMLAASHTGLAAQAEIKSAPKSQEAKTGEKAGDDAKAVDIVTVDKVELKGKFYPCKNKDAACVMLLPALGDTCNNKEWNNFAKKLQEKGFNVLTFDWRGHGESATVQPGMPNPKNPTLGVKGFWDEVLNQQGVKGYAVNKPRPTEIKYENFAYNYYTVLCNDLAAAKAFLDDQQDVNSNNLIIIGVKDGATLGALWLNSEFHRFKFLAPGPGTPKGSLDRQNPEGLAVAACVWISISSTLGASKNPTNVASTLEIPGKINKVPMLFVYGQGDDKGKTLANACEKFLTGNDKKAYPFTGAKMIDKAEKASGKELLLQDYETTAQILEYLDQLSPSKMAKVVRKTGDETYMWEFYDRQNVRRQASAKDQGSKLLKFSGYSSFLR